MISFSRLLVEGAANPGPAGAMIVSHAYRGSKNRSVKFAEYRRKGLSFAILADRILPHTGRCDLGRFLIFRCRMLFML